jgi:hypothetical protein
MPITSIRPLSSVSGVSAIQSNFPSQGLTRPPVYAPVNNVKLDSSRNHLERSVRYLLNQAYLSQRGNVSPLRKPIYPEANAAASVRHNQMQIPSASSLSSASTLTFISKSSGAASLYAFMAQHGMQDFQESLTVPRNRNSAFSRGSSLSLLQRRLLQQGWRGRRIIGRSNSEDTDRLQNTNQFDSSQTGEISGFRTTPVGATNEIPESTLLGARPNGARYLVERNY